MQHTPELFANGTGDRAGDKAGSDIITHLQLNTDPMGTIKTLLRCLIIDTDQPLTTWVYLVYQVNLGRSSKKIYLVYEVRDMTKKSEYITFRTDEKTKRILEGMAKSEDRTLSYIINRILNEYLTKEGREE